MAAIPKTVRTALEYVLEYLWADEEKDFESYRDDDTNEMSPEADDHIFRSLQVVADWLNDDGDDGADAVAPDSPTNQLELVA